MRVAGTVTGVTVTPMDRGKGQAPPGNKGVSAAGQIKPLQEQRELWQHHL